MFRSVLLPFVCMASAGLIASCAVNSGAGSDQIKLEIDNKKSNPDFCNEFRTTAFTLMMGRLVGTPPAELAADVKEDHSDLDATIEAMVENAYTYPTQSTVGKMNTTAREFTDDWVNRTGACV